MKDTFTELQVPFIEDEIKGNIIENIRWRRMGTLKQLKKERQMMILATIRKLQFATRRHLMCAHKWAWGM